MSASGCANLGRHARAYHFTAALRKAAEAFIESHAGTTHALPYYLNMLEEQIREAREHLDAGNDAKANAEVADCIAVAYEALLVRGEDPECFTAERIASRILGRIEEINAKYGATGRVSLPEEEHARDAMRNRVTEYRDRAANPDLSPWYDEETERKRRRAANRPAIREGERE